MTLRLLTHSAFKATRKKARFLVHGVVPRRDITVVWGKPKSGKTFWVLDVGLHVTMGWAYHGRACEKGAVIYCPFEGKDGIGQRLDAFCAGHNISAVPDNFLILADRLTFNRTMPKGHKSLIDAITETGLKPALIVLDTLNRSLEGSENSDEDMTYYTKCAEALADTFEAAVIIVHHCGTAGDRPRGHTSLTGTCAAQIAVSRTGERGSSSDMVTAFVEFMKDGQEGTTFHNWMVEVALGPDDDGLPISSCYLEAAPPPSEAGKSVKDNSGASKALAVLEKMIASGIPTPSIQEWRDACVVARLGKGNIESKRKAFRRAADTLIDRQIITYSGSNVILIEGTQ